MEERIVGEARDVAARYGRVPSGWELREIIRTAQVFMDEGMSVEAAAEYAAVLVLRLHGVEDAPWSQRSP